MKNHPVMKQKVKDVMPILKVISIWNNKGYTYDLKKEKDYKVVLGIYKSMWN